MFTRNSNTSMQTSVLLHYTFHCAQFQLLNALYQWYYFNIIQWWFLIIRKALEVENQKLKRRISEVSIFPHFTVMVGCLQKSNIPVLYNPSGHFLTGYKVCGLQCLICKSTMLPIAFAFVHVLRLLQVYAEIIGLSCAIISYVYSNSCTT